MKQTTNYNLVKPELTDSPPDITVMNPNWDKIDEEMKSHDDKIKSLSAYAIAVGTNAYTTSITGITILSEGMSVKIKFTNANTGASTLNINSLGAKSILKGNGSALSSGNIKAGQICNLAYTGSNFQLLGEGGEYGTATASDVLSGKTIGTEEGIIEGAMTIIASPVIISHDTSMPAGATVYFKNVYKGYMDLNTQFKCTDADLLSYNIKPDVEIFGVKGNFTSDATAADSDVLSGKTYYRKGAKGTGTIPNRSGIVSEAVGLATGTGVLYLSPASGYYDGATAIKATNDNFSSGNIKNGVNIFGIVGTLNPIGSYSAVDLVGSPMAINRPYQMQTETQTGYTKVASFNYIFSCVSLSSPTSRAFTVTCTTPISFTVASHGKEKYNLTAGQVVSYGPYSGDFNLYIYNPARGTVTVDNIYSNTVTVSIFIS